MLAETLAASGVTLTGGRRAEPTTMVRVTVTQGIPAYRFEREATAEQMVTAESLAAALPADARAIHTGSLTLTGGDDAAAWEALLARCHDAGRLVSLDPNLRLSVIADAASSRARILRIAARAHLVKLSDEDLAVLFPGLDEAAAPVPQLADTVGAGDTFTATLLAGLAETGALSSAGIAALSQGALTAPLTRATIAAALNCARDGCNPPSRAELDAALAEKD